MNRPRCATWLALAEMWRTVVDNPRYEVSWDGRVRNARTRRVLKPQGAKSRYLEDFDRLKAAGL